MRNATPALLSSGEKEECRSAAYALGDHLVTTAEWHGGICTWRAPRTRSYERAFGRTGETLGADLYNGASGVALFLSRLCAVSHEPRFEKTAVGALRFSIDKARTLPGSSVGFFSGEVGAMYACYRGALDLRNEWCFETAGTVLESIAARLSEAAPPDDVIGGAAGAIPQLLRMRNLLDGPSLTSIAMRLGESLLHHAVPEPCGLSWSSDAYSSRNLTGLAHGVSGIANALLEVYGESLDTSYWIAAMGALSYEATFRDDGVRNWPDFRNVELWLKATANDRDGLVQLFEASSKELAQQRKYSTAWCHGAPGIGLVRLNGWERFGLQEFREDALIAVETTCEHVSSQPPMDYALCHGVFGNCELLRRARAISGIHCSVDAVVRERILEPLQRSRSPMPLWPCESDGELHNPGLMTGQAGIGLFLLASAEDEDLEFLLPRTRSRLQAPEDIDPPGAAFATRVVRSFFSRSFAAIPESRAFGDGAVSSAWLAPPKKQRGILDEARAKLGALLRDRLGEGTSAATELLRIDDISTDLLAPEQDGSINVFEDVRRQVIFPTITAETSVRLRSGIVVVDAPDVPSSNGERANEDVSTRRKIVLLKRGRVVLERTLQPIASFLVQLATSGTNVAAMVRAVGDSLDSASPMSESALQDLIEPHVRTLYQALVLDLN